ncbi:MAG: glycosyltransferase family 4 protein [Thermoplasmatota archaeon]
MRYPPAPGGAEAHVAALARGLAKRGHDVEVHTTDLFSEVPFRRRDDWPATDDGVRVVRHPARRINETLHYVFPRGMARALSAAARTADIVHAHSYGYWHTVLAARAARAAVKPFVFTPHYHPPWSMQGGAARRALRGVYDRTYGRMTLAAAARIICVASGERDTLARFMPLDLAKTVVIPNGIDVSRFTLEPDGAAFRRRWELGDAPLVLTAGRLAVNKGLPFLVDAFAKLPRETRLVLVGEDQDQRVKLEAQAARLGVGERVIFTGALAEREYVDALGAADVFALASEWEAFGIVLAEAQAAGAPVVATRVGGAPDVVVDGETGFLVPYGDAGALASALARVLADPKRAEAMGAAGRAHALAAFDWGALVRETERVYQAVTG